MVIYPTSSSQEKDGRLQTTIPTVPLYYTPAQSLGFPINMHIAVHLCLVLRCLLVSSVKAAPTTNPLHLSFQSGYQNVTTLNSIGVNGSLTYLSPPWGPPKFKIDTSHTSAPIQREAVFALAVRILAEEVLHDFEGTLAEARIVYRIPQYPDFVIAVASVGPYNKVQRKYLLWAIARAMNNLVEDDDFRASTFTMTWQGRFVGRMSFLVNSPGAKERVGLGADYKDVILTNLLPERQSDLKAVSISAGHLSFDYELWGDQLFMKDVFMATIGGLIQLAQQNNHNFDHFVGNFPGYDAVWIWNSSLRPSILTKDRIVKSMLATVMYALRMMDYHELRVVVRIGAQQIASGGYMGHLPSDSLAISSS